MALHCNTAAWSGTIQTSDEWFWVSTDDWHVDQHTEQERSTAVVVGPRSGLVACMEQMGREKVNVCIVDYLQFSPPSLDIGLWFLLQQQLHGEFSGLSPQRCFISEPSLFHRSHLLALSSFWIIWLYNVNSNCNTDASVLSDRHYRSFCLWLYKLPI